MNDIIAKLIAALTDATLIPQVSKDINDVKRLVADLKGILPDVQALLADVKEIADLLAAIKAH